MIASGQVETVLKQVEPGMPLDAYFSEALFYRDAFMGTGDHGHPIDWDLRDPLAKVQKWADAGLYSAHHRIIPDNDPGSTLESPPVAMVRLADLTQDHEPRRPETEAWVNARDRRVMEVGKLGVAKEWQGTPYFAAEYVLPAIAQLALDRDLSALIGDNVAHLRGLTNYLEQEGRDAGLAVHRVGTDIMQGVNTDNLELNVRALELDPETPEQIRRIAQQARKAKIRAQRSAIDYY